MIDLIKVRQVFNTKKWCQGACFRTADGTKTISPEQCCIFGAICLAFPGETVRQDLVTNHLRDKVMGSVVLWNDTEGRKFEEVLQLLTE